MAIDPSAVKWDDAKPAIDPKAIKWDDEAKLGDSFAPIGDAAPDFGTAKMQPGEMDRAAHTIGMAVAPNATQTLEALPPLTADDAKSQFVQALMGPFGNGDIARTAASTLPVSAVGSGLAGMFTGLGNELVPAFGGTPDKTAADAATDMAQKLSYEPQTPGAKAVGALIGAPFEALGTAGGAAGRKAQDVTGSPMLATAADTAIQALPFLFGADKVAEHTAPKAPELQAAESTTAANPPPTGADALKAVTDAVNAKIEQAAQTLPAPTPVTPAAPPVQKVQAATPKPRFSGPQVAAGEHLQAPEVPNGPAARTDTDLRGASDGGNGTGVGNPPSPVAPPVAEPAAPRAAAPEVPLAQNDKPVAPENTAVAQPVEQNVPQLDPQRMNELRGKRDSGTINPDEHAELNQHLETALTTADVGGEHVPGLLNQVGRAQLEQSGKMKPYRAKTDIDDFKEVNDTLGHDVGDEVLKAKAQAMVDAFGPGNAWREGGDEFGAHADTAEELHAGMAKVKQAMKDLVIEGVDQKGNPVAELPTGVSYGVGNGETPKLAAKAADNALYVDKATRTASGERRGRRATDAQEIGQGVGGGSEGQGRGEVPRGEQAQVAVAEPPTKPEPAKPPPAKPAEAEAVPAEPRDTSVRNAATAVDRATHGLDDLPEAERKGWDKSKAEAADAMAKDPAYARDLAREVLQSKRALSDSETMALGAERERLHEQYTKNDEDIAKAQEAGDKQAEIAARIRRESLQEELDTNHRATQSGGTELARAMAARNAQMREDYSAPRTMTRARVAYGEKLTPKVEAQLKDLTAQLAEKDKRLAELEAKAHKEKVDANTREQARLQKSIDEMEAKLAKRLGVCPL